jgi:hypothetical protein
MVVSSERHDGEQYPFTHPLGPPSVFVARVHLSVAKRMSALPAQSLFLVQAAPVGWFPAELAQPSTVHDCEGWQTSHPWPNVPQAVLAVPVRQVPLLSQQPAQFPGPQGGVTARHCCD